MVTVAELHAAIERDELRLEFQPYVELTTGRVIGAEALVRWEHPERGRIDPDAFIPMAESTGAIGRLGSWVLAAAARQGRAWEVAGLDLSVSVNVSAVQLDADLPSLVAEVLLASGLDPARLVLEITETAEEPDPVLAVDVVAAVRSLGVGVALDDFGEGYSWLGRLRRLPVDSVKLDRSLVSGIDVNRRDRAIVDAIVSLGRDIGFSVTGEGIETVAQAVSLRRTGCALAQGYLASRPVAAAAVEPLARGRLLVLPAA